MSAGGETDEVCRATGREERRDERAGGLVVGHELPKLIARVQFPAGAWEARTFERLDSANGDEGAVSSERVYERTSRAGIEPRSFRAAPLPASNPLVAILRPGDSSLCSSSLWSQKVAGGGFEPCRLAPLACWVQTTVLLTRFLLARTRYAVLAVSESGEVAGGGFEPRGLRSLRSLVPSFKSSPLFTPSPASRRQDCVIEFREK